MYWHRALRLKSQILNPESDVRCWRHNHSSKADASGAA